MKKRHGLQRALPKLSLNELAALPTGALLARLRRLQSCEEAREQSDLTDTELASAEGLILFKADPAWQAAHSELRQVLATREHIARKHQA